MCVTFAWERPISILEKEDPAMAYNAAMDRLAYSSEMEKEQKITKDPYQNMYQMLEMVPRKYAVVCCLHRNQLS